MAGNNNDDMKKIQEDIKKLNKFLDKIENSVSKQDQMANDISFLKKLMSQLFVGTNHLQLHRVPRLQKVRLLQSMNSRGMRNIEYHKFTSKEANIILNLLTRTILK